ncbi:hypothetical protein SBI_03349 [Streptomyces bingchenggensis BCW-1]|uniref:Uncharacterized protein n=1 Tax=Streptomyces bingchenggensis (strain BCW-1) TaxID=749414 RepID=D7CAB3_STRBB|nr:hypothetical protein SBI_03349 [Streptomyces bingchenggensis BCW-1]
MSVAERASALVGSVITRMRDRIEATAEPDPVTAGQTEGRGRSDTRP